MRRQLVPGLVVHLTVIKAKTWPGIEAKQCHYELYEYLEIRQFIRTFVPTKMTCYTVTNACALSPIQQNEAVCFSPSAIVKKNSPRDKANCDSKDGSQHPFDIHGGGGGGAALIALS